MTTPYLPYPAPSDFGPPPPPERWVPRLSVENTDQRRWTVALRGLLAIPGQLLLLVLVVASIVVLPITWVATLITGRTPDPLRRATLGYLYVITRVYGFMMLLTDRLPPFSFAERPDYPVHFSAPPAARLSRLTVLFRAILAAPVAIVLTLATAGWWVLSPLHWLVVLITRRYPQSMFAATASVLRAFAAYTAYILLLTDRYPIGVLYRDPASGRRAHRFGSVWNLITLYLVAGLVYEGFAYVTDLHQFEALRAQSPQNAVAAAPAPEQFPGAAVGAADPWQQLAGHVPASLRPSCVPFTGDTVGSNQGVTAALTCSLQQGSGIPDALYYYQYRDQASLDNALLQMTLIQKNRMTQGPQNCANDVPAAGPYASGPASTDGLVACGRTDDGTRAFLDVADAKTLTLMDMPSSTMTDSQLYAYWLRTTFLQ
jgi:hypothetical protein